MLNRVKRAVRFMAMLLKEEKKVPIPDPVDATKILSGKVALITGGSGGIGIAMAKSFLKSGAKVVIAGTSEKKLHACCEKIGHGGGETFLY